MCGICGAINYKEKIISETLINNMMVSIKHRGPDGEGAFTEDNTALGHVRLSIIDLSEQANQPMFSDDGNLVIVFNGEIYNYQDIKNELPEKYTFKTNSDTEVILNAYKEWGEECLHKFNGMFAFAIYNRAEKTLFAARDPFGIKPFYYYASENHFVFGSEIKAILASGTVKAELNEAMLYDFIVFNRTDHTAQTSFKNICNLRPGHKIKLSTDTPDIKISQWYFLSEIHENKLSFEENAKILYSWLSESVRLHLVSDVPVGSALSGGIDSSTIVCLMRQLMPANNPLYTFSAVYDSSWEKDEKKYVDILAQHIDISSAFTYPNAQNLADELDKLIHHQEEPFSSASLYASWCVYKEAGKNNIKVLLNGQGADELFAYDYMAAFFFYELFRSYKWFSLLKQMYLFKKKQKSGTKFTFSLFAFLLLPKFLRNLAISGSQPIVNKDFFNKFKSSSSFYNTFFDIKSLNESVKNHLLHKLHHLLRVEDKNAMTFSVEGRVPFLEKDLVACALNTPAKFKVYNGEVKYILKQCMKHLLPPQIFTRNNKIGYATPMDAWFRESVFVSYIDNMLQSPDQPMEKYLNLSYVKEKWIKHKSGTENNGTTIWKYLFLTRWYQLYFKKRKND